MAKIDLQTVSVTTRPLRRLPQLVGGLVLYGASMGLMVRGGLGLDPWDVLHEALSRRTGLTFGTVTALVGLLVLLCWIPLRQRPGVGTVANILVIAVAVDLTLAVVGPPSALAVRIGFMVAGVVLNGLATAAYIGVRLGPGPRDGLMTGFAARTRLSIRVVRTAIEVTVLATGWLLGGTVGIGTVVYALAIGPLAQAFLPLVTWRGTIER
ncbi:YczE/YyaS/YitT family protein [Actinophytocola sp.]|uniref:membrane protein YczE n=1 Tax=Actinophytocola sp. TaxID=1872138 RepID=UPI0039C8A5B4